MKINTKISGRKKLAILGFTLYVTFILLSAIPYIAESQSRGVQDMDSKYTYNLVFEKDGVNTHYDVERVDTNEPGTIVLTYTTSSHTLSVTTTNLKKLIIDCESIYEDESMKVFKENPSGKFYKDYFIDNDKHFTVLITADNDIALEFQDTPKPVEIKVDGKKFTDYTFQGNTIALGTVEKGSTEVELYFKEQKAEAAKAEDEDGLLGLGKIGGIDVLLILILIIVVIIIAAIALFLGKSKKKEEEEEVEEEVVVMAEDEVIEEEEEQTYDCPECGAPIKEDQANCSECGTILEWDEEEIEDEDSEEVEEAEEEEYKEGENEEDEEGEDEDEDEEGVEYECPDCGASISEEDTSCPECGAEFE